MLQQTVKQMIIIIHSKNASCHYLYTKTLCNIDFFFVFSHVAQFQSKRPLITVKACAGTFLLFLGLFAGTRAARGTDWGQSGLSAPPVQTGLLVPKHENSRDQQKGSRFAQGGEKKFRSIHRQLSISSQ